jgi:hypothetical protein
MPKLQESTLLPEEARILLRYAAQTAPTKKEPLARIIAIEKAVEHIRAKWPQYFGEVLCESSD